MRKDTEYLFFSSEYDFKNMNIRERLDTLGLAAGRVFEPIEATGYPTEELKDIKRPSSKKFCSMGADILKRIGASTLGIAS